MDTPSETQQAIVALVTQLSMALKKNPNFRIEDLVPSVPSILKSIGLSELRHSIFPRALADLVATELAHRATQETEIDRFQYHRRFPDYVAIIDRVFEQFANKDPQNTSTMFSESDKLLCTKSFAGNDSADDSQWQGISPDSLPTNLGQYQNIQQVGSGGFGVVCSAWDSVRNCEVALKFPRRKVLADANHLRMFLEEADRVMRLDHSGIVKTFAVEQIEGFVVTVQQFISGGDLKHSLSRDRSYTQIAELLSRIASALAYASRQGIIHRDLKPANILLDENDQPYIADFGMALDEADQLGAPNVRCGTIPYMSTQLAAGLTRNLDGRTDIWSVGVIMYELLTGRRPFLGQTAAEILEQIESRDPKPLRQIKPEIPRELERICLKCLEKRARDRYLTADDLAEDLQAWITDPEAANTTKTLTTKFVPQGLRSYGREDAAFFLKLVPGPRDRYQVPASIRFWKSRIAVDQDPDPLTVGILYGPSGSGKSSFVKAGLLPQLGSAVDVVYVEATQSNTEQRLIAALQKQFPSIPSDITLVDLFEGLSKGQWKSSNKKLLIVLDQFEQRLCLLDNFQQAEMARALRFCDGTHLQTMLLVRDDFWLALTRFIHALEMDLNEGHNAQAIDLFDRQHAQQVLCLLGQAYGKLPDDTAQLSEDQKEFLELAINQLAEGNQVICVRIVLFSELFKNRPWTMQELESVGGWKGVGKKFLQETFDAKGATRRHQIQAPAAKAILEALLPSTGTAIRGVIQTEQELLSASQLTDNRNRFDDVIKTLDNEFRLITAVDPETEGQSAANVVSESTGPIAASRHFQLTHDFLVPSIRDWLYQDLTLTAKGRAQLRLRELADTITPGQKPRNLPTHFEWLTWQWHLRGGRVNEKEKVVLNAARRKFLLAAATSVLALAGTATPVFYWNYAAKLIDNLKGLQYSQLPDVVKQLPSHQLIVKPKLLEMVRSPDPDQQHRGRLGLVTLGQTSHIDKCLAHITRSDCGPLELEATIKILDNHSVQILERLKKTSQESNSSATVFRCLVGQIAAQPNDPPLDEIDPNQLSQGIIQEPIPTHSDWIRIFAPPLAKEDRYALHFHQQLLQTNERSETDPLAESVFYLSKKDACLERFISTLTDYNHTQFRSVFQVLEQHYAVNELLTFIETNANGTSPQAKATRAVSLLRLVKPAEYRQILNDWDDLATRAYAIYLSVPQRVDYTTLASLLDSLLPDINKKSDKNGLLRQGILLSISQHIDQLTGLQRSNLESTLNTICLHDPDPGSFAAAEYLERRRNGDANIDLWRKTRRDSSIDNSGVSGSVFINSLLIPFSIIEFPEEGKPNRRVAIQQTELTQGQVGDLVGVTVDNTTRNSPVKIETLFVVYQLCFNFSKNENRPRSPIDLKEGDFSAQHTTFHEMGYRPLTFAERDHLDNFSKTTYLWNKQLADQYCWHLQSRKNKIELTAQRFPDPLGLYDMYGNCEEITYSGSGANVNYQAAGSSNRSSLDNMPTEHPTDVDYSEILSQLIAGLRLAICL